MDNKTRIRQKAKVCLAFMGTPRTMLSVAYETKIERANICRYVAELLDEGRIVRYKTGIDEITKCRAGFYSSDPKYFPVKEDAKVMAEEDKIKPYEIQ